MSIEKEIEALIKKIELEELKLKLARVKRESENFHRKGGHRTLNDQMGFGYPLGAGHPNVFLNKKK